MVHSSYKQSPRNSVHREAVAQRPPATRWPACGTVTPSTLKTSLRVTGKMHKAPDTRPAPEPALPTVTVTKKDLSSREQREPLRSRCMTASQDR